MNSDKTDSGSRALRALGVAAAVAAVLAASPATADEVSELKAAVQALQKRLDTLEAQAKSNEETNDRQTDQIAQAKTSVPAWVPNFALKGDLRYRNENIDAEYAVGRNRDRIRVRAGFVAKVNDTITSELQLASAEGGDPRSSNQTLTGENTRKSIYIDLAYAEWKPHADWKLTAGKMKYPWARPGQSILFDGDINPEGLAVNFNHGPFFASSFFTNLEERSATGESTLFGGQVGWKQAIGTASLTLGASLFDFNSVQHRNPFFGGSSNGNTTTTVGCFPGQSPCLLNDYNLVEGFAEYSVPVAGRPLSLYADYIRNDAAVNSMDTAYSAGIQYGRASNPRTWEIGYFYQKVEKDSLNAQFVDSDFAGGNSDGKGGTFKAAYAFARNWTLNLTYFMNKTNIDVPVNVAGVGSVLDRDYKRLQVDMNFKY
ncbi:MAG: putative porin [Proteobacteria bacterium]|jgi:Putative porin|nr:putative porin [Pseudomonadota bacterium]MBK9251033.1 putative porin [Pseudomonadota bacterium]